MRDKRRRIPIEGLDFPVDAEDDPEFDRLWVKALVERALTSLGDDASVQALRLQMKGRTHQQIADRQGRKVTDITNGIHRARERLKREIERLISEYVPRE